MWTQPLRNKAPAVYASPMTARLRSWTRQHVSNALLLVASGLAIAAAGCGENEGLGRGTFSYVCPAADPADPSAPSPDAACGSSTASLANLPEVAVAAPFSLQYSQSTTGPPRPAVASLATSTAQGWSFTQPGWLGFVAWSGSDVVDFTHVHAEPIASLRLEPAVNAPLSVGTAVHIAATPLDARGAVLGGAIACTFTASGTGVVSIQSSGRAARVVPLAAGEATLAAACAGANASLPRRPRVAPATTRGVRR